MHEGRPRVFVDTNVWVSAFVNPNGPPAHVLDAFLSGRFVPVISEVLLDEIGGVLKRPRVRARVQLADQEVAEFLLLLKNRGVEAFPTGTMHLCRDPRDDVLLETAVLGRAQFAVSRDDDIKRDLEIAARLHEYGVEVLSVAQFLRVLASLAD